MLQSTTGAARRGYTARRGTAVALAIAMLATGAVVWRSSYAAFTATTPNSGNQWSTGTVAITNDQSGGAVFNSLTPEPDSSRNSMTLAVDNAISADATSGGSACIKVTYQGTMAGNVRLYASITTGGDADGFTLDNYLLFAVDIGTDTATGSDLSCATFTRTATIFGSGGATTMASLPTDYNTASATEWAGATQNSVRWYRLSWLLPANVSNNAQGETLTVGFTWEAQNA